MMLRSLLVGCGQIAGDYDREIPVSERTLTHAGAYRVHHSTELVCVVDADVLRAEKFSQRWQIPHYGSSLSKELERVKPDVVSICTPVQSHLEIAQECLAYRVRGMICEKPLAVGIEEAKKFIPIASQVPVVVNYFRRYNTQIKQVADQIRSGNFGSPIKGVVRYTKGFSGNGSHLVDLLNWFFGMPISFRVLARKRREDGDDGIDAVLTYEKGLEVFFQHVHSVDYVFIDMDLIFDKSRLVLSQRGQKIFTQKIEQDKSYPFQILQDDLSQVTDWDHCLYSAIDDLVDCVLHDKTPKCGVPEGLQAMRVCDRLRHSDEGNFYE